MDNSEKYIRQAKKLPTTPPPPKKKKRNAFQFKRDRLSERCSLSHYGRYLSQDCNKKKKAQPLLMKSKSIYEDETPKSDSDKGRIPIV